MKTYLQHKRHIGALALSASISLVLAGCSSQRTITNLENVGGGASYQAEYRDQKTYDKGDKDKITPASATLNAERCLEQPTLVNFTAPALSQELFNTGDLLEVSIGTDVTLSGKYEIASDGTLKVRDLPSILAFGRSVDQVTHELAHLLVQSKYYTVAPAVSIRISDYGPARVFVQGAVFEAGDVGIGDSAATQKDTIREDAMGAITHGRRLSRSLQSAGGIRPDADLSRVEVRRGKQSRIIDVRPAITGGRFNDVILLEGDQVTVPSRGCFQSDLVTPSVISPPGTKVFMSNLTEPANSNANSAINKDTREMRYGTRMLQTIVSMNCVGGSKLTNSSRSAVLYSRNPVTGKSIVIERNIEELVRNANRDDFDPFILPNDALACYDSGATDIMKLAQSFGIVAGAIVAGRGL